MRTRGEQFACGLQTVGSFFLKRSHWWFSGGWYPWLRIYRTRPLFQSGILRLYTCTTLLFIFIFYPFENVQMIQLQRLNRTYFINFDVHILCTFLEWLRHLRKMRLQLHDWQLCAYIFKKNTSLNWILLQHKSKNLWLTKSNSF